MLKIHLMMVGNKMPLWVEQGCKEYQKRIHGPLKLHLTAVPATWRGKRVDLARLLREEAQRLRNVLPTNAHVIALDRGGKTLSTLEVTENMRHWMHRGQPVALLIGGPEGLAPGLLDEAHEIWSLSALTLSHPVARVVVAEQLYRCHALLEGLPYHR